MEPEHSNRGSNFQMRMLFIGSGEPEFVRVRDLLLRAGNSERDLDHGDSSSPAMQAITPLRDTERAVTHFISNDRDITEKRNLEAQRLQAQKHGCDRPARRRCGTSFQ